MASIGHGGRTTSKAVRQVRLALGNQYGQTWQQGRLLPDKIKGLIVHGYEKPSGKQLEKKA